MLYLNDLILQSVWLNAIFTGFDFMMYLNDIMLYLNDFYGIYTVCNWFNAAFIWLKN